MSDLSEQQVTFCWQTHCCLPPALERRRNEQNLRLSRQIASAMILPLTCINWVQTLVEAVASACHCQFLKISLKLAKTIKMPRKSKMPAIWPQFAAVCAN